MSRLGGIEEIYGGAWRGPEFVITHRPPVAPSNPALTFFTSSIDNAVATALTSAEGKNIVLFGATIPRQCLNAGVVDEILIHLVPVLPGDGIRLYEARGFGQVNLEPTYVGQSGQVTNLRFRVVK